MVSASYTRAWRGTAGPVRSTPTINSNSAWWPGGSWPTRSCPNFEKWEADGIIDRVLFARAAELG